MSFHILHTENPRNIGMNSGYALRSNLQEVFASLISYMYNTFIFFLQSKHDYTYNFFGFTATVSIISLEGDIEWHIWLFFNLSS